MQPLDLNVASRPFKNNLLPWIGFVAAVLALIAISTRNVQVHREHREWLASLQVRVDEVESERQALERRERAALAQIAKFDLPQLGMQAEKANEVIRWKAFSWTQLFNRLQEILPYDVQMSSIHPIFRPESSQDARIVGEGAGVPVSVEGLAKNLEAFLELERALFRDPTFSRVEPEGTDTDDTSGEIVFRLRFFYDPHAVPTVAEAQVPETPEGSGGVDAAAGSPDADGSPAPTEADPAPAAALDAAGGEA